MWPSMNFHEFSSNSVYRVFRDNLAHTVPYSFVRVEELS